MKLFRLGVPFLVALFLPVYATAQRPPLCDVECGPDPGSGNYGGAVAARPRKQNARGYASAIFPKVATTAMRALAANSSATLAGSQSYDYTIPVVNLPGRSGLDLVLNLYYNSRIWDVDTVGNTVTFNADRDFPSYGFRLDFGYIEYDSTDDQYILTETDGTKRALPNISSTYQSDDGSFIAYTPSTRALVYSNGNTVQFAVSTPAGLR